MIWRLWATVAYDGTDFSGFQIQAPAGKRTVQGELERALEAVTGTVTRVIGAGRTDRGVHARGQVIGFEAEWRHHLADLHRALNAVLATDVAVLKIGLAPQGFHPRFSAVGRMYRYTLLNRPVRSPLDRRMAWHVVQKLDMGRMNQASQCLVGTRDFATFGSPPQRKKYLAPQGDANRTVRTVSQAVWRNRGAPAFLVFDIKADAFLYRMVRSIVGTLVLVGSGQISVAEFEAILQARDRSQIRQVAPAHGLCLMRVDYGHVKEFCSEDIYGKDSGNST